MIGILEFAGGYLNSDLDAFASKMGMPNISRQVRAISVNGGVNKPDGTGDDVEVTLDIQFAAASYWYATGKVPTIYVFFAPNSTNNFVPIIQAAVANKCDVLTSSWGLDESFVSGASAAAVEAEAQAAAAAGLVIFCASGDNSSRDQTSSGNHVLFPASCPHIIGCGGTNKQPNSEVVWGDGNPADLGTGGGFSAIFPVQSFQKGAPRPPRGLGRMVPDITGCADNVHSPMEMYIQEFGGAVGVGGTSCVAPLYAGLFAALGKKLGFITPKLWTNQADYFDVTRGSNGGYNAATGPDPCSGIGRVIGTKVASLVTKATIYSSIVSVINEKLEILGIESPVP